MKYAVVFEKGDRNFAAYVPDLPRCISTGKTRAEVEENIREAIAFPPGWSSDHRTVHSSAYCLG